MPPPEDLDLLNAAPAGILAFRDDGRVVAVNDTLLNLLAYRREDVVGGHVERLMGVAGRIFFQTHLFPLVRMHGHADEIYMALRTSSGESVPALLNTRRDESGDEPLSHCVVIRVKERKKYEDELLRAKKAAESAHKAKSRYLRSVSHEIRTPINALLGYADLLELNAGRPMGDQEMGYVGRIRSAARHLLGLVNDVLDLAKIESGAMSVGVEPARITDAVGAALGMVEPQARARDIRIIRPDRPIPGSYSGDHERVVQVLINLFSNAVKFTDPGGSVSVDWARVVSDDDDPHRGDDGSPGPGPWLRVRVTDTGIGIPTDQLHELFQPFHQVQESGRESPGGTGLGLAISRELARLMGGDITVLSEPGEGSTFTLWLVAEEG